MISNLKVFMLIVFWKFYYAIENSYKGIIIILDVIYLIGLFWCFRIKVKIVGFIKCKHC